MYNVEETDTTAAQSPSSLTCENSRPPSLLEERLYSRDTYFYMSLEIIAVIDATAGFLYATAKVVFITAMIFLHIILHPAVLIYIIFINSLLHTYFCLLPFTLKKLVLISHHFNSCLEQNSLTNITLPM